MTLEMEQVIRIQVEIMLGHSWENHTDRVPDTPEAHKLWDEIAADIEQATAKGYTIDIPNEMPI